MNRNKKSFLLHIDSLDILDELTDEQAGKLFKAIKAYQKQEIVELDSFVRIAFSPFKNQFIRDNEKYDVTCKRRAEAGRKGGEAKSAKASKPKQELANASNCQQELANVADNKNKNKNKTNNKSEKEVNRTLVATAPKFNFKQELLDLGVNKNTLDDWLTVRKRKKASNTKTSLTKILNQISKANLTVDQGIEFACSNDWKGFEAEWYFNKKGINKDILSMSAASDWHKEEDQGF